ncbi:Hsp70 family protein [Simplicispira psychrophila]|uniref:Hsp70 family protein n=1 Tax=Simplicispira psychrophila TaxID=80882 RepID=UPI000483A3D2|nr:Hsp70 family protein [Simplicispira psychrophila]
MSTARYTVGIDLGTSHTVVAYADLSAADAGGDSIHLLPIDQLIAPGEVAAPALLPSLRYHPAAGELSAADLVLPWSSAETAVLGRYARDLGSQVPGRLVSSAKSWLSHPGVDRSAAILPWGAADDVEKISPVAASASYLAHVHAAWNARFPSAPLAQQDIVLTVPASFDEGARALTLQAARDAGLGPLRLLEEPQAAFHDWLFCQRQQLAAQLHGVAQLLVCDVGGGTTDLTLIHVEHTTAKPDALPRLTRIGVGEHLMLGGDNMDLALAHHIERTLGSSTRLPAARFAQLVQRCRTAKELLLGADAPAHTSITLLGGGAQLVGGARSVTLTRAVVERLVVDGFMPQEEASIRPQRRRSGLVELGLPYPADAAITRHLAAFLERHSGTGPTLAVPDTLLLNGGVFRAPALAQRLEHVLTHWRGAPVRVLQHSDPDTAVARGAVAYALVRAARVPQLGHGVGGGSARSYFLLLEDDKKDAPPRAICVLPRGTDSAIEVPLLGHSFALCLGQAVRFHLVACAANTAWQAGDVIDLPVPGTGDDAPSFVHLPPLETVLPAAAGQRRGHVTVQLSATMTEVGTLEMHCTHADDPAQRWLLAFQVRSHASDDSAADSGSAEDNAAHPRLDQAIALIERVFGSATPQQPVTTKEIRQLRSTLEHLLGARDTWSIALLRTLFDALWTRARRRRRSAEHERVWLNLAGYCLRPGMGTPLDSWRIDQLWPLFSEGIQYTGESRNWSEWWTLWRRAAGGLNEAQQLHILETLAGHLEDTDAGKRARHPVQGSYDDMVRLAALLEQLPGHHRAETGRWVLERLQRPDENPQTWWALGRLGARVPLYGSAHTVVPAEIASGWLQALLALDWKAVEPAAFAAAQIARMSGDRTRDLAPELREQVARRLAAVRAPASWVTMVREAVQLDDADQKRSFGEALPPGLRLLAR